MILDPVIQKMVDELAAEGAPPVYRSTPEQARDGLVRMQSRPCLKSSSQKTDVNVDFAGQTLRLRIFRPTDTADRLLPVILYFHGGGWVLGDSTTHDRLVRELAVGAEAAVVFVDYDRAPEHRYPVAIEQAHAAIRYVTENPDALRVDAKRVAIAGDSAGGNIATVACLMAAQRSHPRIAGQLLFYPVTSASFESESFKQFEDGPWLTKAAMQWFWDQYLPDATRRNEPWASPLLASKEQLACLPRTLIITAENDVLRDQAEEYGRKLITSGVEVVTTRYNGTIHDFAMLNQLEHAAPTRAAIAQAIHFLKRVLSDASHRRPCD
jgi:acetyl esterase